MRKIGTNLIHRMTSGDLLPLLNCIKSDGDLRLEVRQKGDAVVYYRKGKALAIKTMSIDPKYGNTPSKDLPITHPDEYFRLVKISIDNWLSSNKERGEFDTQQNVAKSNQGNECRYIIIDMEYAFDQSKIAKVKRVKSCVFDLIGIDTEKNKVTFFEVKKGMGATKGKSGIEEHINDFRTCIYGENSSTFIGNLFTDIKNIIEDKWELGILQHFDISNAVFQNLPDLVFVFHPDHDCQIKAFAKELNDRCELFVVDDTSYKLQ